MNLIQSDGPTIVSNMPISVIIMPISIDLLRPRMSENIVTAIIPAAAPTKIPYSINSILGLLLQKYETFEFPRLPISGLVRNCENWEGDWEHAKLEQWGDSTPWHDRCCW